MIISIEFDDPITAGKLLTAKLTQLLKIDLERNYLFVIYDNREENFKFIFLINNSFGRIEESKMSYKTGNSQYT